MGESIKWVNQYRSSLFIYLLSAYICSKNQWCCIGRLHCMIFTCVHIPICNQEIHLILLFLYFFESLPAHAWDEWQLELIKGYIDGEIFYTSIKSFLLSLWMVTRETSENVLPTLLHFSSKKLIDFLLLPPFPIDHHIIRPRPRKANNSLILHLIR